MEQILHFVLRRLLQFLVTPRDVTASVPPLELWSDPEDIAELHKVDLRHA